MPNPQLAEYVRAQLAKGIDPDVIKKTVLAAGWMTTDVNAVFLQLTSPTPSSPAINTSPIQSISMQPITPAQSRQHLEQGIMPQTQASFPSDRLASPSELLTFTWHIFVKKWKTLIGIQLLSLLMLIAPIAVMMVIMTITLPSFIRATRTTQFDSPATTPNISSFPKTISAIKPSSPTQFPIPSLSPMVFIIVMIALIPAMVMQVWGQLAMIYAIKNREEGIGVKAAFGRSWRKILPLLGVTILITTSIMTGYILLFIPGLIFLLWFFLSPYALVYEDSGVLGALLTSRSLTRSHKLAVLGRMIVLGLCYMIPIIIIAILLGIGTAIHKNVGLLVNFASTLILQLTAPAFMIVYIVGMYESLKAVKGDVSIVVTTKAKAFFVITALVGIGFIVLMLSVPLIFLAVNPVSQLAKARDVSRTYDIRNVQDALNQQYAVTGVYPTSLDKLVPVELQKIPTDPKTYEPYTYQVQNSGQDYELCATFEANGKGVICVTAHSSSNTPPPMIKSSDIIVPEN